MQLYLDPIWSVLYFLFCSYVVWTWVRWFRLEDKDRFTALAGLCFATASTGLSAFLFVHAIFTGGYPLYHPVELFCIFIGGLTALLGLVAALHGKGKLRLPIAAIAILNLLLWLYDALVQ